MLVEKIEQWLAFFNYHVLKTQGKPLGGGHDHMDVGGRTNQETESRSWKLGLRVAWSLVPTCPGYRLQIGGSISVSPPFQRVNQARLKRAKRQ